MNIDYYEHKYNNGDKFNINGITYHIVELFFTDMPKYNYYYLLSSNWKNHLSLSEEELSNYDLV